MNELSGSLILSELIPGAGKLKDAGGDYGISSDGMVEAVFSGLLFDVENPGKFVAGQYAAEGTTAFEKMNGQFAIVLLDFRGTSPRVILVRDHHGQRSLFYARRGNCLSFSTSLNLIKAGRTDLDWQAAADYFSLGYIPAPRTIYRNIRKVPNGSAVYMDSGERTEKYWNPYKLQKSKLSIAEAVEQGKSVLEGAVSRCLTAAPNSGVLLSGGVDSNLVLSLSGRYSPGTTEAFTIGFQHPKYDERSLAAAGAEHTGVRHFTAQAGPEDFAMMPELLAGCGEPYGDSSLLPSFLAMKLAAEHGKSSVLMGDGGDELFCGYVRYQIMLWRSLAGETLSKTAGSLGDFALGLLPGSSEQRNALANLRRLARSLKMRPLHAYASFQEVFSRREFTKLSPELASCTRSYLDDWEERFNSCYGASYPEKVNELDLFSYLPDDCCRKETLALRGAGVQGVSPLLDLEVSRFAFSLPLSCRINLTGRKRVLREIGKEMIPDVLLKQKKRGFGVPVASWLRGELLQQVRQLADEMESWDSEGLFSREYVRSLIEEHISGRKDNGSRLWILLCFRYWKENQIKPGI